mmetsp:Transcript_29447/g.94961  ORF Transcript_29447/g.94961 Transcript_29447/m.94961 type:complete len:98 (+) Transcript_29447:191-484(+)
MVRMFLFSCCAAKESSVPSTEPPVVTPMPASSLAVAQVVPEVNEDEGATRVHPDSKDEAVADAVARPAESKDLDLDTLENLGFDDDGEDEHPHHHAT